MLIFRNIIWIDNQLEYTKYINELKYLGNYKISFSPKINEGINIIKGIKFEETVIIIGENLYSQFIMALKQIIKDIYIIPRILIFSKSKTNYIENNYIYKESIDNPFLVDTKTNFEEIKQFLLNSKVKD